MTSGGYVGEILKVDLSLKKAVPVGLDAKIVQTYLGGLGLAMKILYDEVGPDVDALSPDNIIIAAPGPLSGTATPTNSRTEVVTKSPLTGIIGAGNFGGWWGARLKLAGFEGVVIRKKSDNPVYLWIDDGKVEIRNAEHIWGKDTKETVDALRAELGEDVSVLAIGPAGENLVRFACPVSDYWHAPGRGHAGCVMGAKKLKAIAVRGTKEVPIADPEKFKAAVAEATDRVTSYPEGKIRKDVRTGSNAKTKRAAELGTTPAKNFTSTIVEPDNDIWGLPESASKHLRRKPGYYGYHCPMSQDYGCDLITNVKTGKYAGLEEGGICYSFPSWQWGANLGVKSYPAMWKCRDLANRYGMDQATPIPFAMELFEKGIITKEDTDGLELKWGDETVIHEMLHRIAYREGLGDVLAEGSARAAKKIGKGAQNCEMTVKGMEILPGWDPRVSRGPVLLGIMTCPRGGDDLKTTHTAQQESFPYWAGILGWSKDEYRKWLLHDRLDIFEDVKQKIFSDPSSLDVLTTEGIAVFVKWYGELTSIFDSLGLCMFAGNAYDALGPTHFAKLYSACTGWQITPYELMKTGERIFNLMRAYIVREGLTRKDDCLPDRFYKEPIQDGPNKGAILSRDETNKPLNEYYKIMGWNIRTGVPTKEKLIEIDLDYVANELSVLGLI